MQYIYVQFTNAGQINGFVNMIDHIDANFRLGTNGQVVDPKSIMGVLSLDLSRPQLLQCDSDDIKLREKLISFFYHKNQEKIYENQDHFLRY